MPRIQNANEACPRPEACLFGWASNPTPMSHLPDDSQSPVCTCLTIKDEEYGFRLNLVVGLSP